MGAIIVPPVLGRRSPLQLGHGLDTADGLTGGLGILNGDTTPFEPDGVPSGAYDRVVRIVSWVFILATSTIVAITGLWRETQPSIFALLALAGIFVLIDHELLPPTGLGAAKLVVEGSVAITFATLLV